MPGPAPTDPTHFVHIYATIRVKIAVHATSHLEAMKRADRSLFDKGFGVRLVPNGANILDADYAEEVTGYLVDEADDPEYLRSATYNASFDPDIPPVQHGSDSQVPTVGPDGSDTG